VKQRLIRGPWTLKFLRSWGPQEVILADSLYSWSDHAEEAVKFYSGEAEYSVDFNLDSEEITGNRILLDLGNVQEIASVRLNGQEAGVSWIAPFRHDITGLIKEGSNKLVVTVVNSWVNRLVGDRGKPQEERFTRTNVLKFEGQNSLDFMRKSGLLSEVSLLINTQYDVIQNDKQN
jgi:beta-galactosidase/beta-glucuronidase